MRKMTVLSTIFVFMLTMVPVMEEAEAQRRCRGEECRGRRGGNDNGNVNRPNRPNRPPTDYRRPNRPNRPNRPSDDYNRPNRPNRPVRDYRRPNRPGRDSRVHVPTRRWNSDRNYRRHRTHRHRPNWHRPSYRYTRYTHVPYRRYQSHTRRYLRIRDYHYTVPYRYVYWNTWLRWRISYNDGYRWYMDYPYFVYNGYLHRYSHIDTCNYDLVDSYDNTTYRSFGGYTCATGYDLCADLRDSLNWQRSEYRYFCSERFEYDSSYSYNWNYDDDFYSDLGDVYYDDDYYYDDDFYYN
jgi:hypothetical protein